MFTVKFATGKSIKANAVSEDYFGPTEKVEAAYRLNINTNEDYEIDYIIEMINEEGALDSITITSDEEGTEENTITGYTKVDSASKRLQPNGKWAISITILK